ncbi:MAG: hypothetical protein FJW14_19525 [Acidimicrobiia bacterium]|nr:hypothetical protein [Acidimicrobiia bacterium]
MALHESHYVFLVVLAVHVLTLAVFAGTTLMIDLRLLGVAMARAPVSEIAATLLPWSVAGFVVMLVTGSLLFYAAPVLRYENLFFRAKMTALVLALVNAWACHRAIARRIPPWDGDAVPPRHVRLAGGVSIVLWAFVITTGRLIPYQQYWF